MHLTKKSKTIITVLLCILLVTAATIGAYLFFKPGNAGPKQSFNLYFLDSTGANFATEKRSIEMTPELIGSEKKLLTTLVNALLAGPKDSVVNKRAIPADAQLKSLRIGENRIATINFSEGFKAKTDLENYFSVCTIVLTICDTGKADKVNVQVEGQDIIGQGIIPLGALGKEDIVNASKLKDASAQKTIQLYYPNATEDALIKEERALQVDGGAINETVILTELIKGSKLKEATNVIPASTKVLSCETKEGICYVNLSKDFIDKKPQGSAAETMVINSIVQTLTNLDGVNKVMFLIEGEKVETYGQMVFDEPFSGNQSAQSKTATEVKDNTTSKN